MSDDQGRPSCDCDEPKPCWHIAKMERSVVLGMVEDQEYDIDGVWVLVRDGRCQCQSCEGAECEHTAATRRLIDKKNGWSPEAIEQRESARAHAPMSDESRLDEFDAMGLPVV